MAVVKSIDVVLRSNVTKFEQGIKKSSEQFGLFARTVKSSSLSAIPGVSGLAGHLDGLISKVNPATAAVGIITAGFAALAATVRNAMQEIDRVGDVSLQLGIDPNELLGLEHAAMAAGVELTRLEKGLQKIGVASSMAASGSTEMTRIFDALGLDAKKLATATPDAALRAIADGFQNIRSPAERTKVAVKLFGEEGISMLRILNQGSAGLEKMRQRAFALGRTIEENGLKSIDKYKSGWAELKSSIFGFSQDVYSRLTPAINIASDAMSRLASIGTFLSKTFIAGNSAAADAAIGWGKAAEAGEVAAAKLSKPLSAASRQIEEWKKTSKSILLNPEPTRDFDVAASLRGVKDEADAIRKSIERTLTPMEEFIKQTDRIHALHAMDLLTIQERNAALEKASQDLASSNMERMQQAQERIRAAVTARSNAVMEHLQTQFEQRLEQIAARNAPGPAALERGSAEAFSAFQGNRRSEQIAKDQLAYTRKMETHLAELKRRGIVLREAKLKA